MGLGFRAKPSSADDSRREGPDVVEMLKGQQSCQRAWERAGEIMTGMRSHSATAEGQWRVARVALMEMASQTVERPLACQLAGSLCFVQAAASAPLHVCGAGLEEIPPPGFAAAS